MPGTINGIGTIYLGRTKLEKYDGICSHCHRELTLISYETRLWFAILYIPLIPIGKRRVFDQCPACTYHFAVPLKEWKERKQRAVEAAAKKMAANPDDAAVAIELHKTLVDCDEDDKAQALADVMAAKFGNEASVQAYLGGWYLDEGLQKRADPLISRALFLDPDKPAVKRIATVLCIKNGELDEARSYLAFMLMSKRECDPNLLVYLADAYYGRKDHENALAVYGAVLEADPKLAKVKGLRKRIKTCEKVLGRKTSIIPRAPFSRAKRTLAAAAAVAVLVLLIFVDRHLARNQTLHIVNRLPVAVEVSIDGEDLIGMGPGERRQLTLGEGHHQAVIKGPAGEPEAVDFRISNSILQRWGRKSVFVLNPGGAAMFVWDELYYATPEYAREGESRLQFGEPFIVFRDIDYAFKEAPDELDLDSEKEQLRKTQVTVAAASPSQVIWYLLDAMGPEETFRFAEFYLELTPGDPNLLENYVQLATAVEQPGRCKAFLEKGLDRRPVAIEWHRTYQGAATPPDGDQGELRAQYDRYLAAEPDSSALLYLRGRIEEEPAQATRFFDRAAQADPNNAYPWYARAWNMAMIGNYAAAKPLCERACGLLPGHDQMASLLAEVQFAVGDYAPAEDYYRRELLEWSLDLYAQRCLLEVLVASGDIDRAQRAHRAYEQKVKEIDPADEDQLALWSQLLLCSLKGDTTEYLECAKKLADPAKVAICMFEAHLELGNVSQAQECYDAASEEDRGLLALLLSLAWAQEGENVKAQLWREKTTAALAAGDETDRDIAALLQKGEAARFADANELEAPRGLKAPVLVALAGRCPADRVELLALAERLNLIDVYAHRFLKRTIASMRKVQ